MMFLFTLLAFLFSVPSQALKIEITKGVVEPDPIAVLSFVDESEDYRFSEVIGKNLTNSGLFSLIDSAAFIQDSQDLMKGKFDVKGWRALKARFVLYGYVRPQGNEVTIDFRLYDVSIGKKLIGGSVKGNFAEWRRVAHKLSDEIYTRITSETGMFDTHIAYVELITPKGSKNPRKKVMRIDQDGFNPVGLTSGQNLVLTPRYAPDGQSIAYFGYEGNKAYVYLLNLRTHAIRKVNGTEGITYTPRFSSDSKNLIMGIIKKGASAIYTMDVETNTLTRLTEHRSIDTSPCFSPDGKKIVFTTDRFEKEHLMTMDRDGANLKRISFGEGKYSQPVWSPRGDLIAFTKQVGNQFYIGVMTPDGVGERMIAQSYLVEAPCWSSNGRYIVFTQQVAPRSPSRIRMVDLTGLFSREINTPSNAADPAWSPLLS